MCKHLLLKLNKCLLHAIKFHVKMVCVTPQNTFCVIFVLTFPNFPQAELENAFLCSSHSFFFIPLFDLDSIQFDLI